MELIPVSQFLARWAENQPVIDVRSPGEYLLGHIPRAVNIPLFSDSERAEIGTLYKQVNRNAAILRGLDIVGPKMPGFIRALQVIAKKREVLIYCWRGGMRSESMGSLFTWAGYNVFRLENGYKSFRSGVTQTFSQPLPLLVLGGKTGSGKTSVLKELKLLGEQVVDLEGLAHHKGSAFGALGQDVQPATQHFENLLWLELQSLDLSKRIWVEDESASVGKVSLPSDLFRQIRSAPVLEVRLDTEVRLKRIMREYANFTQEELIRCTEKITKRLGPTQATDSIRALESNHIPEAARIILDYYDKAYSKGIQKRDAGKVYPIDLAGEDPKIHALMLKKFADNHPFA
jgi:tRNA 2-selenouridine synthase